MLATGSPHLQALGGSSLVLFVIAGYTLLARPPAVPIARRPDPARGEAVRYRAAVVETYPSLAPWYGWNHTAAGAVAIMLRNVEMVDLWAGRAAAKGAQIVVFPEDIISSFGGPSSKDANLFSVRLPSAPSQLCTTRRSSAGTSAPTDVVGRALACVAKRHDLVVVVGMGLIGHCEPRQAAFSRWPMPCDASSREGSYDGAAAFGPDGTLLGTHRRMHLGSTWAANNEPWVEAPVPNERTPPDSFKTPFGVRFGFLVDTDVNFGEPMLSLLQAGVR